MPSLDKATALIGTALAAKLDGFGFVKSYSHLTKRNGPGWQAITIGAQRTRDVNLIMLDATAQIRIDVIEKAYMPFHMYLNPKRAKLHPTLEKNCIELFSDRSLVDGFRTDTASMERYAQSYALAVRRDVLPWLDKYSIEENLLEGLIDDNPFNWATSDRLVRYPVLLAIFARRGEWTEFKRIADEFSSYCEESHAQVHKPFAEAMIAGLTSRFHN